MNSPQNSDASKITQLATDSIANPKQNLANPNTNTLLKKKLVATEELDRLTQETFYNPFDVLHLGMEASDEDMKRMYRLFTLIVHPDKCKDPRAQEAFHIVEQAYKLLLDVEKRKIYVRIMREAREKTEYERGKENKRRQKFGLPLLPEDTFEIDYKKICKEIFVEIEERKLHQIRLEQSQRKQKIEEYERRKMLEQFKVLTEQEWEESRDDRVNKWRKFSTTKVSSIGTKYSDKGIRPPTVKQELRTYTEKRDHEQKRLDDDQQQKQ